METLKEFHTSLKERFETLATQRPNGGSVFALEHGLSTDEIKAVKIIIRQELEVVLKSPVSYYLPLLVVATEVGYQYRGNDEVFWRILEEELGYSHSFDNDTRQLIRRWFQSAHQQFKIAKPLETAWSQHRSIITWPITNAILPLDIRLQFMESLAKMPQKHYGSNADEIVEYLRNTHSENNTTRYRGWLKTMPSVGQLAQAIITNTDESPFFSSDTLQRLQRDMEQDKINGVKLSQLRNRIRENYSDSQKPIVRHKVDSLPQVVYGKLFLTQKDNGTWILEGELPEKIARSLRENDEFKRALRSGSLSLMAWNKLRIKPACFLRMERLEITPDFWSGINPPFLQNTEFDDLQKIGFRFDCPLFFQKGKKGKTIESDTGIVVCIVKNYDEDVAGIRIDEHSPNGFRILRIDTSEDAALDWCRNKGVAIREKRHWHWICLTGQIDDGNSTITVFQGDSFYLAIEENYSVTVKFQNETPENATGLIAFEQLALGEYSIEVDDETWSVLVSERESTQPLFTADLQGEMIVDSLRNRLLTLRVESPHPFVNVDYKVSLSDGADTPAEYSNKFESFPFTGGLFQDAFCEKESDTKTRFWQLIRSQKDLKLCLEIGNVCKQEWTLESPCFGIWWKNTETENPVPESDGEEVIADEVLHKAGRYPLYPDDVRLICAVAKGENGEKGERIYRAATVWKNSVALSLGNVLKLPDRKLRQTADTKNGIGLECIVDDILAFRQVQTESIFAEMQRRKILDELETVFWTITCGEEWTQRLKKIGETDVKDCFVQHLKSLIRNKLQWAANAKDKPLKGVPQKTLSDDEMIEKCCEMEREVCKIIPNFWRPFKHDTQDTEEQLSNMVFEILKPLLKEKTGGEGLNGYIEPTDWNSFLDEFTEIVYGRNLADFICLSKADRRDVFENSHDDWSLKSTAEYVEKIQKTLSGNPYLKSWNMGIIRNVLAVFLKPSAFEATLKQETLMLMLSDRQSMRCISYLCWRKQQYEKIQEAFDNV
ncbi:MAG: hypothetical protein ACRC46_02730 [Thermoguttaceae bacterium]